MKINISKIKDNIVVVGLTMVISGALWYVETKALILFLQRLSSMYSSFYMENIKG